MSKKLNQLTADECRVIIDKGTERPFSGEYTDLDQPGLYLCKQCDEPLFRSQHKFQSSCGWPSFDDEIDGAVKREVDADGRRTEILCANCHGHLGHVFIGEGLTPNNLRHCVNSIAMKFVSQSSAQSDSAINSNQHQIIENQIKQAYFAGGCFWGVEHLLQQQTGVIKVESGYMGGHVDNPSYQQVCTKATGHLEVVEVSYYPNQISFTELTKRFFEIHDPTQANGQGPDIGSQYLSAIFVNDQEEASIATDLITQLEQKGLKVATQIRSVDTFWKAEDYHQDYYQKNGQSPYCHQYQKKF